MPCIYSGAIHAGHSVIYRHGSCATRRPDDVYRYAGSIVRGKSFLNITATFRHAPRTGGPSRQRRPAVSTRYRITPRGVLECPAWHYTCPISTGRNTIWFRVPASAQIPPAASLLPWSRILHVPCGAVYGPQSALVPRGFRLRGPQAEVVISQGSRATEDGQPTPRLESLSVTSLYMTYYDIFRETYEDS